VNSDIDITCLYKSSPVNKVRIEPNLLMVNRKNDVRQFLAISS